MLLTSIKGDIYVKALSSCQAYDECPLTVNPHHQRRLRSLPAPNI